MNESELVAELRAELGRESDLVLWRNHTGVAERGGRTQRFGLVRGGSDLVGILTTHVWIGNPDRCPPPLTQRPARLVTFGRWFALEAKTARGRVSREQEMFLDLVRARGGFAAVVRSVQDGWAALARARAGANA